MSGLIGPVFRAERMHAIPSGFVLPQMLSGLRIISSLGRYYCSVSPESLIDTSSYVNTYYVDRSGGNNANTGLSWAQRKKSIESAKIAAIASGVPSRILVYTKDGKLAYPRADGFEFSSGVQAVTVPLLVEPIDGRLRVGAFDDLTWALVSGKTYTYQATRSNVLDVYDLQYPHPSVGYKALQWVSGADATASVALVESTEGSWWTDNVTLYVHPYGNDPATNDRIMAVLNAATWNLSTNQNILLRNIDFCGGNTGALKVYNGSTNAVVVDDCSFRYAAASNTANGGSVVIDGVQCLGAGLFAGFDSRADRNAKDGFNFHSQSSVAPNVLLVDCSGMSNGKSPSQSNNGFTTHDGVVSIDIGGKWIGSVGGNSAHVNDGTKNWSVGSVAGGSVGDIVFGGTGTWGGFAAWQGGTRMWLDSCRDVGCSLGVYAANGASIFLRNHFGSGARSAGVSEY